MKEVFQNTMNAMLVAESEFSKDYIFYAHMIAQCKKNFDLSMQAPAAVSYNKDKYILHINPALFDSYSLQERLGVLKHEMLHILNGHINRLENREFLGWNYATDCAINQQIDREHLPEGCIYPDTFPSKKKVKEQQTSEYYYNLLEDPKDPNGDGSNGSIDDHSKWEESEGDPGLQKEVTGNMIEKATENTAKSKGKLPANINEYIQLHKHNNEVNWKKLLQRIVGNKKANTRRTLMRRDRRFPNRPDIKGKTKDRVFNLLVVADVSGSVDTESLIHLLGEVQHICALTNTPVDLIQIDTEAYPPQKLNKNDLTFERTGMGGTELFPAIEMAKEHNIDYGAIVVTTDGWLANYDVMEFKKLNKPVIWLVSANGDLMPEMNEGMMTAVQLSK